MWTAEEIAAIVGGRVHRPDPAKPIRGFSIDSRRISPGDLFVALSGKRTDGHLYVREAYARGAHGALVRFLPDPLSDPVCNCIEVSDPLEALQRLARAYRRRFRVPLIGITGSSGKTTTKELLYAILRERYRAYRSPGNYNSEIGLPLALLGMPPEPEVEIGVFELALQRPGEIALLAEILEPSIGLITTIGDAHLGFFRNREELARAKWALVERLDREGTAVLNFDAPFLRAWATEVCPPLKVIGFGIEHPDAAVRAAQMDDSSLEGLSLEIVTPEGTFAVRTPLLGRPNVYNVLGAVAAALELEVPVAAIQRALERFRPVPHRLELKRSERFGFILDDTYNANTTSVKEALRTLAHLQLPGYRKVFVFGDMLELGKHAVQLHRGLADLIDELAIDLVFTVGKLAAETAQALAERNSWADRVESARSLEDLGELLETRLRHDRNLILIKGSRGMELEQLAARMS